jgi:hypothetical protein
MAGTVIAIGALATGVVAVTAAVLGFVGRQLRTGSRLLSPRELRTRGSEALATVLSIRQTGGVRNHLNVQCQVAFQVRPADGTPPFDVERDLLIPADAVPEPGDTWPAWYLPDDRNQVVVAAPAARAVVAGSPSVRSTGDAPGDRPVAASQHSAA